MLQPPKRDPPDHDRDLERNLEEFVEDFHFFHTRRLSVEMKRKKHEREHKKKQHKMDSIEDLEVFKGDIKKKDTSENDIISDPEPIPVPFNGVKSKPVIQANTSQSSVKWLRSKKYRKIPIN
jgi:hypothetical protein